MPRASHVHSSAMPLVSALGSQNLAITMTHGSHCCRAFASWKEFVAISKDKQAQLQWASRACFASQLQRSWTAWTAHVHRQRLLRRALESRQVGLYITTPSHNPALDCVLLAALLLCCLDCTNANPPRDW